MVNIMHVEKELFESFSVGHTHTGAEPGKYFGVGWKYNINTDSIREFYLKKKKNYTLYRRYKRHNEACPSKQIL